MSQSLSTDGFRWLNNDEIQELFTELKDVPEDGAKGYILEVDLEIPLDKHDYFNQYVPAPEHLEVTRYVESIEQVLHGKAGVEPCQVHQTDSQSTR